MIKRDLLRTSLPLLSRPLFVLIGPNNSGKTGFQRYLIEYLCDAKFTRLPRDKVFGVRHPLAPRNFSTLACANRSYQEKRRENGTVQHYLSQVVPRADVTIISSHCGTSSDFQELQQILHHGRRHYFNVAAVFFENALSSMAADVAELDWNERLIIPNPMLGGSADREAKIRQQLESGAHQFGDLLINRTASL